MHNKNKILQETPLVMIKTVNHPYNKMIFFIFLLALGAVMADDEKSASDLFNEANSQFSAKMFAEVAEQNPGKSIVLSPFSTLVPLSLLGLASQGESHDQILRVIGLPNDNVTKAVFPPITKQLLSAKSVQLKMANRVYIMKGFELNGGFAVMSKNKFDTEVKTTDFVKREETAQDINNWVEQQTNHRIKNLAKPESFGSDTRAVLMNAIYFKGNWLHKFDEKFTRDKDFYVTKDKTIKLPTMFKTDDYRYGESTELGVKILEMPYEGYEASLYIFLPNEIDGITSLEQKLKDPAAKSNAIKNLNERKVDLSIPKFKIETTINLKNVLTKLGADKMFDSSEAKLYNLLKDTADLYVSEAQQKAVIEINEEGAEAAAANEFVVHTRSFKAIRTYPFIADRPFYFMLKYGDIELFSGVFAS